MFRLLLRPLLFLTLLSFASCSRERVVLLEPKEGDLVVLNGCVVSACNYLAVTKARHTLEPNYWAKILLVRFVDHPAGHAYCVWETNGTIYGYDRNSGGFPIPVYTRDPRSIAIVLAQELSKVMGEPLSVQSADFVDPGTTELYSYATTSDKSAASAMLSTAPFQTHPFSLRSFARPSSRD